jgi:hypothetical protein
MGSSVGGGFDHQSGAAEESGVSLSRVWPRLAVALLLCVSVLGCGGGRSGIDNAEPQAGTVPDPTSESGPGAAQGQGSGSGTAQGQGSGSGPGAAPGTPGANSGGQPSGAPGAPGGPSNQGSKAKAIGAPINIPVFQEVGGLPVAEINVEGRFKAACNSDEVCVKLVYEPRGADLTTCIFAGTRPAMGTRVERADVVVILCTPGESPTEETPPTEPTQPTEQTAPPDDTQSPPTSS